MNDKNTPEQIESSAATVDEAISEALLKLGARRDEVEIEVVEEGRSGVLGMFGRRQARVIATRKRKRTRGRRGGRRRGGRRSGPPPEARRDDEGARREAKPPAETSRPRREPAAAASGPEREGDRSRRRQPRTRRDRGGNAPEPRVAERPIEAAPTADRNERERPPRAPREPREAREPRAPRERRERHEPRERRDASPPAPARRESPSPIGESHPVGEPLAAAELVAPTRGLSMDDAPEVQRSISEELMRRAGFPGRCTVVEGEYNQVKITVDTDSAAVLIGRHGSTIDSVEHLVERMANQAVGDHAHMNLDINNYRRRREGQLTDNAEDAARQMLDSGKDVHTPPLSPRERRIVHMAIADIKGVTTYTAGLGPDRHVVVTADDGTVDRPDEEPKAAEEGAPEIPEISEAPVAEAAAEETHEETPETDDA